MLPRMRIAIRRKPSELPEAAPPRGWLGQLRAGLARSSARLTEGINAIFLAAGSTTPRSASSKTC